MKHVLIDTDVLLDFFFDRQPFSTHATGILSLCESGKIRGYVTPVICSNTYYVLRQTSGHARVIEKMNKLIGIMDVLHMNRETVIQALNSGFTDFEDALQSFAAQSSGKIDVIITRNVKDFKKSEVGVMAPDSFLKLFS